MTATSLNPFRTLTKHRNFRLFWFGQTLSLIGTWMQSMAEGWLALQLSNSAFVVGVVATAASLPILLFSLYTGVLVDRTDKLRAVKFAQLAFSIQASTLWWLAATHRVTVTWLIVMAAINGTIASIEIPARQSLIVELVGREDLPGAIALNSSGFNLARVVGPSAAAITIAALGLKWCFGINALSYIAVLAGLFMIRLPPFLPPDDLASPMEGIREGVQYMRGTPSVSALMKLVTVYSVLGVPYITLMPVVARDLLGMGAAGYGTLLAFVGIGGLSGALWLAAFGHRYGRGRLLEVSCLAFAALLVGFSLSRAPWMDYLLLLAIGFMMIVNSAQANSMLQHIVPDEMRGRLMAAYSLVVVGLSQVIGSFVAGAVARAVGVDWAIGGGAAIMLVYVWWAFRSQAWLREL